MGKLSKALLAIALCQIGLDVAFSRTDEVGALMTLAKVFGLTLTLACFVASEQ
jgi:hypothetical protein